MSDISSEEYRILLNKLSHICKMILTKEENREDQRLLAVCTTEIYKWCTSIIDLITKISNTNLDLKENNLDDLLSDLVNLKIQLYDELFYWMKDLRVPLQKMSEGVADMTEHN